MEAIIVITLISFVGISLATFAKHVISGLRGVAGFFSPTDESLTNL